MDYYLFNIKNNKVVKIKEEDVLDKLYFLECRPLTTNEINNFKKSKDISKDDDIIKIHGSNKSLS